MWKESYSNEKIREINTHDNNINTKINCVTDEVCRSKLIAANT